MTLHSMRAMQVSCAVFFWMLAGSVGAATVQSADLVKAKKEAESKGYVFLANREEIVAKAREEGQVRVLSNMNPDNIQALRKAFTKMDAGLRAQAQGPRPGLGARG